MEDYLRQQEKSYEEGFTESPQHASLLIFANGWQRKKKDFSFANGNSVTLVNDENKLLHLSLSFLLTSISKSETELGISIPFLSFWV